MTIVVQPAASAAPTLRVTMAEGKFHGVIIELDKGSAWEMVVWVWHIHDA